MMDAAYFTGRKELLDFFNDLLALNLTKIEQTASGAIACQLTELIFPGSIPLSKINWEAKSDYEFIQNYKLLQVAFTKHNIQRYVDVDKLIRAKYQDNLEFCQWLKAFYDQSGVFRDEYNPMEARERGKGGKKYNQTMGAPSQRGGKSTTNGHPRPRPGSTNSNNRVAGATKTTSNQSSTASISSNSTRQTASTVSTATTNSTTAASTLRNSRPLRECTEANKAVDMEDMNAEVSKENEELKEKVAELETNVANLEEAVLETEQERQFYFEKLRNVEVLLQVYQENATDGNPDELIEKIFKILYAVRGKKKLRTRSEWQIRAANTMFLFSLLPLVCATTHTIRRLPMRH